MSLRTLPYPENDLAGACPKSTTKSILFSWNPPLEPITLTSKKPSTSSRQPTFFDQYLVGSSACKCLPSLVQDLAANVDRALLAASETPPPIDDFFTAKDRERALRNVDKTVTDEKGVANFYDKITATFCTPLASTLALHSKASISDWSSLLVWTHGNHGDRDTSYVIRDSSSPFATWEIKSLFASPLEVMLAVPKLGNFFWTLCTYPKFSTDPKHVKELRKIEGTKVGADALAPPWNVNNAPLDTPVEPSRGTFWNAAATGQTMHHASTLMPPPLTIPSTPASAAKNRGTEKEKAQEERAARIQKRNRDDDDENYKDPHDLTAESLVQQVKRNIMSIEYVYAHRGLQTLYVSDLIKPSTCEEDMIDRTKQRSHSSQSKLSEGDDGNDPAGGDNDKDDQDDDPGPGSGHKGDQGRGKGRRGGSGRGNPGGSRGQFQGGAGRKDPSVDELDTFEKTMQVASKRDMLLLYLQYDSPIINTYTPNDCLSIDLTSEIGRCSSPWHTKLMNMDGSVRTVPLNVVVKLVLNSRQPGPNMEAIAICGFFDDTEGGLCALVMLHAGEPLQR
ncbi:hypothetical protein PILCRDRAFT_12041 [Piloderma croceum F 1598]|uniref:Uncharacterized protein n=1 Tax=Piloderma croceum (strain F 1598) TaxID=765440 RepID=A0A0C3BJ49_PILCF|nr:hypothetical protein PILCRDRAFT_12041 [Piloderma croceum F 1598]